MVHDRIVDGRTRDRIIPKCRLLLRTRAVIRHELARPHGPIARTAPEGRVEDGRVALVAFRSVLWRKHGEIGLSRLSDRRMHGYDVDTYAIAEREQVCAVKRRRTVSWAREQHEHSHGKDNALSILAQSKL